MTKVWLPTIAVCAMCICARPSTAQGQTEFDKIGFQSTHDYMELQSFEHVDAQSGNLIITLPMLTLPGNAGRPLAFELTYNTNVASPSELPWSFGMAGMPMRVIDVNVPSPGVSIDDTLAENLGLTPQYVMADGARRPNVFLLEPNANSRLTISSSFWKYDRDVRKLYMPDGAVCSYDQAGRLTDIVDAFGNDVALDWSTPGRLTVVQTLGNSPSRTVTFELNHWSLPGTMTFDGRTWQFTWEGVNDSPELREAIPPGQSSGGSDWRFAYDDFTVDVLNYRRLSGLTTPQGGQITYGYAPIALPEISSHEYRMLLHSRRVIDPRGSASGDWTFAFAWAPACECSGLTTIDTPTARIVYTNGAMQSGHPELLIDGGIGALSVRVTDRIGNEYEYEERRYQQVPVIAHQGNGRHFDSPEISTRTFWRDAAHAHPYVTTYAYASTNSGNYHHPMRIVESGDLSRVTDLHYKPILGVLENSAPFIVGLQDSQTISQPGSNQAAMTRCWNYDASGFKVSATEFGSTCASAIATTFTSDGFGNVATATKSNGKTTSFTYSQGQVSDTRTPEYAVARTINADGTVASDTTANRMMQYAYDSLSRPTVTQPPGATNPILTTYDNANGAFVTSARGNSVITTTLDGFGRPIATINGVGIRTTTRYDAEGRKTFESYPFQGSGEVGTSIVYDALDRVTSETNPDGTRRTRTYRTAAVAVTDERNHTTIFSRAGFGHPDDARLTSVVDAGGNAWAYGYNALGALTSVNGPDGVSRSWTYNDRNLLASETHPESGTVTYQYDAAGVMTRKTDARGTLFQYQYDGNDRVTVITAGSQVTHVEYEAGSDNRISATVGSLSSRFIYESGTGRLSSRADQIDGKTFSADYAYDGNDNLTDLTYPSGRKVHYAFDRENRITAVSRPATGEAYASGFAYHPSGTLTSYRAGNGVETTITVEGARYRTRRIQAGALDLSYDYDEAGNIISIADPRAGRSQSFSYDLLDRLSHAASPAYGSSDYAYDAHGNRQGANYAYASNNRFRLAAYSGISIGYDNNGNLTSGSQATYSYNANNQMDAAHVGGTTTSYAYDADGWRVKKAVSGAPISYYVRAPNGQLLMEWSGTPPSPTRRDYIYAGSRLIAVVSSAEQTFSPPPQRDTLRQGQALGPNTFLQSNDGVYTMWYQPDGNLVLYDPSEPLWNSATAGTSAGQAIMQGDGNFVVYGADQAVQCHSHTNGNAGAYLKLLDDGTAAIYSASNQELRRSPGPDPICAP